MKGAAADGGFRGLHRGLVALVPVLLIALVLLVPPGVAATAPAGYDISYPQCNAGFPTNVAFGIVGVNGGLPYSPNPCLGTGNGPSELSWAGMNAQLYANTANPGPALSSHWPNGQTFPKPCNTPSNPGPDTGECAYDYGWNAVTDSYQDAVQAYVSLGWAPAGSTRTPVANRWWLDVETANSWRTNTALNVDELQGELDYLQSVGAAGVGFYAIPSDWQTITGSTTTFAPAPSWLGGVGSQGDAQAKCAQPGFTGGPTELVQYSSGGFDADYDCSLTLSFSGPATTLVAGAPSAQLAVQLGRPPGSTVPISLTSSSAAGRFATDLAGPWSGTLTVSIPAGSNTSGGFYYKDTLAGSPTLSAAAIGYITATQVETVSAAALASISVSPTSASVRIGTTTSFRASGADRFGNAVTVSPRWSVSPMLGSFSPNPGNPVNFRATKIGRGTVTATVGSITGKATVTVKAGG